MNLFVQKCNIQQRNTHWTGTAREDATSTNSCLLKNKKNKKINANHSTKRQM